MAYNLGMLVVVVIFGEVDLWLLFVEWGGWDEVLLVHEHDHHHEVFFVIEVSIVVG